jgi:amino acid adenylation domain-containing protein
MILTNPGAEPDDHMPENAATTIVPCSQAQQRFWFEERLHPGNPGLNVAVRWRIDGDLSDAHLSEAWRRIVARHQTLRTSLTTVDEEIVQVVASEAAFSVTVADLRMLPEAKATAEADRLASESAHTPFDLAVAPLIRVTRARLTDDSSILLVTAHHTVCDGWSIGILAREMGEICAALQVGREPELPALPLTYGDYAAWEREWLAGAVLEDETAFSKRLLDGYKQFELLTDHPRPAIQSSNGAIASVLLDRHLTNGLTALARDNGCTLFMLAYASLLVLLHRYSGETDIALGTQVVGRDEPELEHIVGCFINTIALRADVGGNPTFAQLLERVRDIVLETFEIRHFPLERLIEVANPKRDLSRNSLFSINFIFQRSFIKNDNYGRFALTDLPSRSAGALYDLNFFMVERPEGWRISCEYNTDLFEERTVTALLGRFETLFRSIVADPTRTIGALPILDAPTRNTLVVERNRTTADYPADRTMPQLFEERAALTPDATAVVCGDRRLTYAELSRASDAVARDLRRRGCAPGGRVGVLLHRSTDLVVALLGVMKSGSAYVPLDPTYPLERLASIAEDAGMSGLVTRLGLEERLPVTGTQVFLIDSLDLTTPEPAGGEPVPAPGDAAYVIYTSGSTGRPKGVAVSHRALVNFLWSMRREPGLSQDDTLVAVTTVSFDIAGLELYLPLVTGATLVVAQEETLADGAALLRLLQSSGATVMQATPVTWQLLIDAGWTGSPKLRVLCGGEAVPRSLAERLLDRTDDVWNMYGPTETTIWSSADRIERGDGPVPLGPPIANTQFYVLDASGEIVPPGAPGELFIGGDGVALGYFGADAMTAERFVPDGFSRRPGAKLYRTGDLVRTRDDGRFEFLGRTDHQIKLRGFRIELGEIEAVLRGQPGVADAVVVAHAEPGGDSEILAYAVPHERPGDPLASQRWTDGLRSRLVLVVPSYMVPAAIVALDALPRTPNGKIDRRALPAPERERVTAVVDEGALSLTEIALTGMLSDLLRRKRLGIDDDIFALGFHSLLAVRLVARIANSFGITLPLRALFSNPTARGLAAEIDALCVGRAETVEVAPIVTLNPTGSRTPFIFLHSDIFAEGLYCRRLAAALGPDQPIHTIAPHGTAGLPRLSTIEAMASDFLPRIRAVQPEGPYRLGGFCVSGLVAYELARRLRAAGDVVEDVVMINSSALPPRAVPLIDALVRRIGFDARLSVRVREILTYNIARCHAALVGGPRSMLALLAWQLRALLNRDRNASRLRMVGPEPFERQPGAPDTENAFTHITAALTYHPGPYDGVITLLWGADQDVSSGDETVGWGKIAREVRIVPVVGGHVTVLHAGIAELARVLVGVLDS